MAYANVLMRFVFVLFSKTIIQSDLYLDLGLGKDFDEREASEEMRGVRRRRGSTNANERRPVVPRFDPTKRKGRGGG